MCKCGAIGSQNTTGPLGEIIDPGELSPATIAAIQAMINAAINGVPEAPVDSVNGETGAVTIDSDDISDTDKTHKFTTAGDISKLAGIESGATADQTAAEILGALLTVDGAGSGLDADTLDGLSSNAFQPIDSELSAIAGLTSAANKGIQFTGVGTASTYDLTAAGKSLLDDADNIAQRATLGLGSMAIQNSNSISVSGGSLASISTLGMASGGAMRTSQVADDTFLIQAWNVGSNSWDTYITLTALADGSSCDLSNLVTKGGQSILTGFDPTLSTVNFSSGGGIRTGTSSGNTVLFQARDVDGGSWFTFGTMTAGNTPTFDFDASVTIGGNVITSGKVASPTATNVTNIAASTIQDQLWSRIGKILTISGRCTIDPTSASVTTELGISIPVASTTNLFTYISGTAHSSNSVSLGGGCEADITNNRIAIRFTNTTDVANRTWHYICQLYVN